ncbi:hypothetical protein [Onishia niordana]|uniref:hypothetical protein n=1 Tax=Onishia niordana TaxID=2508711 RepID=UPI00109F7F57|nr:hypothetical protein [Halomonas niordiana]
MIKRPFARALFFARRFRHGLSALRRWGDRVLSTTGAWQDGRLQTSMPRAVGGAKNDWWHPGVSDQVCQLGDAWMSIGIKEYACLMHDWHALERPFATKVYCCGFGASGTAKWLTCQGFLLDWFAKVPILGDFFQVSAGRELRRRRGMAMLDGLFWRQKPACIGDMWKKKNQ